MKASIYLMMVPALAGAAWGAVQKVETAYWKATYTGAGQLSVQQNAWPKIEPVMDASSNFTHWLLAAVPTNLPTYGVSDAGYVVFWVLNGDAKGRLMITAKQSSKPALQYFSVICSNSNMKGISIVLPSGSTFGTGVPLSVPTWSPFGASLSDFPMILCDGDAGAVSFNCDLWGTLVYAKSIKTVRLKNAYLSSLVTGAPLRRQTVVAGTVTNRNVLIFGGGKIATIVAKRLLATCITVGAPLLDGYMDDMPGVYALNPPGGAIGSFTAQELRGLGTYDGSRWLTSGRYIPNMNVMILSTGIERQHIKRIITEHTSVYLND